MSFINQRSKHLQTLSNTTLLFPIFQVCVRNAISQSTFRVPWMKMANLCHGKRRYGGSTSETSPSCERCKKYSSTGHKFGVRDKTIDGHVITKLDGKHIGRSRPCSARVRKGICCITEHASEKKDLTRLK